MVKQAISRMDEASHQNAALVEPAAAAASMQQAVDMMDEVSVFKLSSGGGHRALRLA